MVKHQQLMQVTIPVRVAVGLGRRGGELVEQRDTLGAYQTALKEPRTAPRRLAKVANLNHLVRPLVGGGIARDDLLARCAFVAVTADENDPLARMRAPGAGAPCWRPGVDRAPVYCSGERAISGAFAVDVAAVSRTGWLGWFDIAEFPGLNDMDEWRATWRLYVEAVKGTRDARSHSGRAGCAAPELRTQPWKSFLASTAEAGHALTAMILAAAQDADLVAESRSRTGSDSVCIGRATVAKIAGRRDGRGERLLVALASDASVPIPSLLLSELFSINGRQFSGALVDPAGDPAKDPELRAAFDAYFDECRRQVGH